MKTSGREDGNERQRGRRRTEYQGKGTRGATDRRRRFTEWLSTYATLGDKTLHNVGQFLVEVAKLKHARGKKVAEKHAEITQNFFPEMKSIVNEMEPSYDSTDLRRQPRPKHKDAAALYGQHVRDATMMHLQAAGGKHESAVRKTSRRASVASRSTSMWPLIGGSILVDASKPLKDQFDVCEELLVDFCEKVALPLWTDKEQNPKLLEYLRYLKIQIEVSPTAKDFNVFRIMGKGGFGLVKGCRTFRTGRMYAMKEMDMKQVKKKHSKTLCDQEHWALKDPLVAESPFCVNMKS